MKKWIALGTILLVSTSFAANNVLVHEANSVRQLPDNSILLSEINPTPRPFIPQKLSSTEHFNTIKTTGKKVNLASKIKTTLNPKVHLSHNKNYQSQHHLAHNTLHQQKIKHLAVADKHSRKISKPLTHHANQPSFAL